MADEVEEAFGSRPELVPGRGGIFDVTVGDELVFSKRQVGRFPDDGEIVALLRQRGGV